MLSLVMSISSCICELYIDKNDKNAKMAKNQQKDVE